MRKSWIWIAVSIVLTIGECVTYLIGMDYANKGE